MKAHFHQPISYIGRWSAFLMLSGCVTVSPVGNATLVVRPEVKYQTQTIVNPYAQGDINHLTLKLFNTSEQDLGISKDLLNAQLDNPIAFSNLKNNTTYRVRPFAYASLGTSQCISTSSYVDIVVGIDDRPSIATLSVQLIDKTFNGQASSTVALTPGGYSPIASESVNQEYLVTTFVGNGVLGDTDGVGTSATMVHPRDIAIDSQRNLYVAECASNRIRKITPYGAASTFAGNGTAGSTDGTGMAATFNYPWGVVVDSQGNLYVTDSSAHRIRKITPSAVVTTFAGNGTAGFANGNGVAATFNTPRGIVQDSQGNFFVADTLNNSIRKITSGGQVTLFAGNGGSSPTDGTGTSATFTNPHGLAIDSQDNLYAADGGNHVIRKITPAGVVTTLAGGNGYGSLDGTGTAASFSDPHGVAVDKYGNVYVADPSARKIRKITPSGKVTTIAGSGTTGISDGSGTLASFRFPNGIAIDSYGNIFVSDRDGGAIRRVY